MSVKVHVGHTRNGRNRWRYFDSAAEAIAFCGFHSLRTGVVLSIVATVQS